MYMYIVIKIKRLRPAGARPMVQHARRSERSADFVNVVYVQAYVYVYVNVYVYVYVYIDVYVYVYAYEYAYVYITDSGGL